MRWLVVGDMPGEVREALVRHGHTASTPAEAGMAESLTHAELLSAAHQKQFDVLTNVPELANVLFEQPVKFIRTLVFLQLKGQAVEQDDAIDRLFTRYKRMATGRLYTVTETRVKVRQLPGH